MQFLLGFSEYEIILKKKCLCLLQGKGRPSIQSYGMLVLDHWFLYLLLEVLWFTSLKDTASKYVSYAIILR